VPDHVLLLLGAEDLFPYRVEFRRTLPVEEGAEGGPPKSRALVMLELYEVALDAPIDPAQFHFDPGTRQVTDVTSDTIKALGLREPGPAKPAEVPDLRLGSRSDETRR
jgi:hypothetical protein